MSLVSIIIPVYKSEKYLEATLSCILSQSYPNIEVILINDASPDNSYQICKRYANLDERIVLINHEVNRGQSAARNAGLNVAKGDYICFVDSDDLIENDAIEKILAEAQRRDVDILGFNATVISVSQTTPYVKYPYDENVISGEEYLIRMMSCEQMYDVVWMYFYKRSVIESNKTRFLEGRIFEDEVWVPEVFLNTEKASFYNYSAYLYYIRESSTMTRTDIYLKKYDDAEHNCRYLIALSQKFKEKRNQAIFCDYITRIYMESVKYLLLSGRQKERKIDYRQIKQNIFLNKTHLKYLLFRLNKKLYFKLKGITI